jgi:hypothetical protein
MKEDRIKIHYIDEENYKRIWIIAETKCGKYWQDVDEYTSQLERVTCKKCLNKISKKTNDETI